MNTAIRKFCVIFGIVFLVVFGIRELLGQGIYSVAQCTKDYRLERCIGVDVDEPEALIDDFYNLTVEYKKTDNIDELFKAKNLIADVLDSEKPITNTIFMKFWTIEVESFVELGRELVPRSNGILGTRLSHCYSRKPEWLALKSNRKKPEWLCSVNYFEMHKRDKRGVNPYGWRVDALAFSNCGVAIAKQCEAHHFSRSGK